MPKQNKTILLVYQDVLFRNRLAKQLLRRHYNVLNAGDYRSAVEIIAQQKPEFAIIGLKISGKIGLDIIKTGIRHAPHIRIVVLTDYGSIATATNAIKLGAVGYLSKPSTIDDILHVLLTDNISPAPPELPTPSLAKVEWEYINRILNNCGNNISRAAQKLGIHRRTLQRKLQKYPPKV